MGWLTYRSWSRSPCWGPLRRFSSTFGLRMQPTSRAAMSRGKLSSGRKSRGGAGRTVRDYTACVFRPKGCLDGWGRHAPPKHVTYAHGQCRRRSAPRRRGTDRERQECSRRSVTARGSAWFTRAIAPLAAAVKPRQEFMPSVLGGPQLVASMPWLQNPDH